MKKIIFFSGLLSTLLLASCFGDDDDGQPNPQSVNLIGEWVEEKVSDNDEVGCNGTDPTTLEFSDDNKVIVRNLKTINLSGCPGMIESSGCQPIPNTRGDYINSANDSGMILFDRTFPEPDGDDFIPPPLNTFRYELEGDVLVVISSNSCLETPIIYRFKRN